MIDNQKHRGMHTWNPLHGERLLAKRNERSEEGEQEQKITLKRTPIRTIRGVALELGHFFTSPEITLTQIKVSP